MAEGKAPFPTIRVAIPVVLPASDRPFSVRALLGTNTTNFTRELAALDEDDGIRQILKLAVRAVLEEQWAYLPGLGLWIEIGVGEGVPGDGPQVESDSEYLARLITSYDRVHLYHFHPQRYFASGALGAKVYPASTRVDSLGADARAAIGLAIPSPTDIAASTSIALLHQRFNPGAEVRNFVVSPYGIVEYAPTQDGRRKLADEHGYPLATTMRSLTTVAAIRRSPVNIERTIAIRPGLAISELISALCEQLTSPNYTMHFTPLEPAVD